MDRREISRKYKENARPMGVFRIRNRVSGTYVIGSYRDVQAILNRQRFQLEFGGHPDRALQAEWNEFGPEVFDFEVLDILEPSEEPGWKPKDDLRELEAMWRERLAEEDSAG